ncbi:MAG: bifunctional demethylmenaquinone methyltransferase/2-methoxy-6-polyprenyl-1,4-benzoquinol methylase UbiE [Acidobacteria bacterium]|nr:bifunctional demethylmenaquinone methyltransferase/2-methoxy-6-polyprenyl-1,4-benzoquinol methylase UbiE [Acidobacteriota bacterium]
MTAHLNAAEAAHEKAVKEMFSGIAGRYDLLNHVMSMNIDRLWRRRVRRELQDVLSDPKAVVLDVACGTGDLSIELARGARAQVVGTDFCRPMLSVAAGKISAESMDVPLLEADAMALSFGDESFDAITIAFGLRNLPNHADGLKELYRILKPGGKLVVLECSNPALPGFRQLFDLYFNKVVPRVGGMISGSRGAYTYLPESVSRFPDKKRLARMMEDAGFSQVRFTSLTGGVAAIHVGVRR